MRLATLKQTLSLLLLGTALALPAAAQHGTLSIVGKGCRYGSAAPTLESTAPVLGFKATLQAAGFSPSAPALVCASPVPTADTMLSPGCFVYLDVDALMVLSTGMTDQFGHYTHMENLPQDPALVGLQVALQAVAMQPDTGLELTQGVVWTLGM